MSGGLHTVVRWLTRRAARAYTAPTIEDAQRICFSLKDGGFGSTVCYWNSDADSVDHITSSCLKLIGLLQDLDTHSYISIKLPAMQFDQQAVATVVGAAAQLPRLVHFDSHGPEDADRMFAVIERILGRHRAIGCTIPGRWLRSTEDARVAVDWKLRVRVVKGQWPDPKDPQMDMRQGFLKIIDELAGRANCVAVASHDVPLAREALCRLLHARTPCELELLHGLPRRRALRMAKELHVPVRFYVPQGTAWLPYLLSHAQKNPRVVGWFVRDIVSGIF